MISPFFRTEKALEQAVSDCIMPSAVIAVGNYDRILYQKAFGHSRVLLRETPPAGVFCGEIPTEAPAASLNTLYDMASLTKILSTTMIALRFLEEGLLTLPDPISRYLDAPIDKSTITVLNLMTHTGGLPEHFLLSDFCNDKIDIVKTILSRPLAGEIGAQVAYSCMGYILLGAILEKIAGSPLDVLAKKWVFQPLGMENTEYNPLSNGKMSVSHIAATEFAPDLGKYAHGIVHDENARFAGGIAGNAGVFSCISDMCLFAQMLVRDGSLPAGGHFLTPATLQKATSNLTCHLKEGRGLGFYLPGDEISGCGDLFSAGSYGHTGFTGTSLFVEKSLGMYVVLLTNRVHFTRGNTAFLRFRRLIHNVALTDYQRISQ